MENNINITYVLIAVLTIAALLVGALIDFSGEYLLSHSFMLFLLWGTIIIAMIFGQIQGLLFSIMIVVLYAGVILYQGMLGTESIIPMSYVWIAAFPLVGLVAGIIGENIRAYILTLKECTQIKEALVTKDELTGLGNSREFYQNMKVQMALIQRHKREMTLAIIEIQYFDELMSLYGKGSYSKVFDIVTAIIVKCTRTEDTIYRISEKTFAVLMPDTAMVGAEIVKKRMKEELASINSFQDKEFQEYKIEVRVGLAALTDDIQSEFEYKKKAEKEIEFDV